jgi:hypothetical protein
MDREVRRGGSQDHSADRCRQCQGLRAHEEVRHQGINDDEFGIFLDIYLVTGFVAHIFYSMRHEETMAPVETSKSVYCWCNIAFLESYVMAVDVCKHPPSTSDEL